MPLGEKTAEDKDKFTGVTINSTGPEGVTMEANYVGELKGFGRFPDANYLGTLKLIQTPSGMSTLTNHGILTTKDGETVLYMTHGINKLESGKNKSLEIISFMTNSQKYSCMNGLMSVREGQGPPGFGEFTGTAYEWKS